MRSRFDYLLALSLLAGAALAGGSSYTSEVEQYRAEREASLKQDNGWLTVAGLFRLKEGESNVGSAESNTIRLPAAARAYTGKIRFSNGQATYFADGAAGVPLRQSLDVIPAGPSINFVLLKRGDEFFIRVRDNANAARRAFTGLKWFPVDPTWRIVASFTPFDAPKSILFDSQNGVKQPMQSPGYVTFSRGGRQYRLEPVWEEKHLFFIFRDATSSRTTYGAARFLYAEPAVDGKVVLDFNKAINPPCAFTPYATCPLPPPQTRLTLAVTAGEKKYSDAIE